MKSLAASLTSQPSASYRKNRYFYLGYDLPYLVTFTCLCTFLWRSTWNGISWQSWMWLLLPPIVYLHVLASVCIHNASHGNFPRAINRLAGEILGVLLVVRFANWEILHVRHHRHADDAERDPHHMQPNFWRFMGEMMLINLERQLQSIHYDQFGDTPQSRRYERFRSVLSFTTEATCVAAWYLLLGFDVFWFLFVPAQLLGWTVVSHFNWITHNGESTTCDYRPVNIDRGIYRLGNRVLFGLYMHANHHKRVDIFNPMRMDEVLAHRAARRAAG